MKSIKRIAILTVSFMAMVTLVSWWAINQTQQVPDFYVEATSRPSVRQHFADRQMKAGVEKLQNDAAKIGSWKASFSDEQINAWLANELPQKFPQLLARGASHPRVVIRDGKLLAAARYTSGRIDTVVSCEIDVRLTEQPNILALHIGKLRAGALPVPLGRFINGISREAARGDLSVQWDKTSDGPVALVHVPTEHPKYVVSPVVVECVQLENGSLTMAGHSGPLAHSAYQPHGPMHEFVSYRPSTDSRVRQRSTWQ